MLVSDQTISQAQIWLHHLVHCADYTMQAIHGARNQMQKYVANVKPVWQSKSKIAKIIQLMNIYTDQVLPIPNSLQPNSIVKTLKTVYDDLQSSTTTKN